MIHSSENGPTRGTTAAMILVLLLAALIAACLPWAARPAHAATTFTVNSTGDKNDLDFPGGAFDGSSGGKCFTGDVLVVQGKECTLRAAIQEANVTPGADTIDFDIPTTGVATISPASQLPTVTGPVIINGYTQQGAKPNTKAVGNNAVLKIELSGASAPGMDGLEISAANSTVKGLVINRWNQGIRVSGSGATGNKVTGNYIGTDASGTKDLGNSRGVYIPDASNNTFGGTTVAERNVISANNEHGVGIDAGADGNKVVGNYICTDASGTKDLGNSSNGVNIEDANNTTVGGATAGARNVISGNDKDGVSIHAEGSKVTGNYIGTDVSGTKVLGNSDNGVYMEYASNNTIGGTEAGARNVISGNDRSGVFVFGSEATGNKVMGNYIGTDVSGTKVLGNNSGVGVLDAPNNTVGGTEARARNVISGNDQSGVFIGGISATGNKVVGNYVGTDASGTKELDNSLHGVYIYYAPKNTIGGATAGERNIISGNGLDGVGIFGDGSTGNRVLSNSIFSNGGLGIDLGNDGVTANDPGDADIGPNEKQNFPVLTSAKTVSAKTTIKGTLNSSPNKTFRVQFFSNPSGTDEGKKFIGQTSATTDASGNVTFAFSPTKKVDAGRTVTATATDPGGNTSEFSAPKTVAAQ